MQFKCPIPSCQHLLRRFDRYTIHRHYCESKLHNFGRQLLPILTCPICQLNFTANQRTSDLSYHLVTHTSRNIVPDNDDLRDESDLNQESSSASAVSSLISLIPDSTSDSNSSRSSIYLLDDFQPVISSDDMMHFSAGSTDSESEGARVDVDDFVSFESSQSSTVSKFSNQIDLTPKQIKIVDILKLMLASGAGERCYKEHWLGKLR